MPFAKRALAAGLQVLGSQAATVWPGHVEYPLGLLDGTDGFRVTAESSAGRLGYSVSGVGDVNNDGFDDVILGESPEFATTAGAAYVVFGSESFSAVELDVSALDGTNGFKIEGTDAGDFAGTAVAGAGDVNGDGFDDVMVGAWGGSSAAGEVFVVFGAATFPAVVGIADLDGSTGFVMLGATTSDAAGFSLAAAGDVNNDGAADIIIGAYQADPVGSMSGEIYVVFGSLSWTESLLNLGELGPRGLTFEGAERREYVGHSVAGAGDMNDDGYSDVIISAHGANEAYVFYGAASFSSDVYSLNTLSGTDGFIIFTGNDGDEIVVAGAGDMNNDGYGDVAIGHSLADPLSGGDSSGATYVVLGGGAIPSPLNVLTDLDGSNGFVLEGASEGDRSGTSVSNAGDINQDGFGDIVVGAPGVGSDAGSAYVVFGGAAFSEASYNIGTIGAEGSYKLVAPSDEGYAGYSVAGAGDMNQDGFPDLVVGAYGSGVAGEAFVVFPGLTGTPPPTMTPTPAPTGLTPAPFDSGAGATPAPTANFLVPGVVGGGTVYESPEVFVQAQELGGEVSVGTDRWFDENTRVIIALEGLHEKSAEGSHVGLGAAVPHAVAGESLVYEATATTNVTVEGVAAHESTMVTSVLGGETTITIIMQVFEEDGVITSGDEQTDVSAGTLKISLAVSDWPFCDPATAPIRSTQDTPSTVCTGASSTLETGAFLDAKLVVRGPSSSTPVFSAQQSTGGEGEGGVEEANGAGLEYGMSGGSAEATLIMSEWVNTDDNGWTKAGEVSLSGTTFTVRFPASSGTLLYDPTLELKLIHDDEDFWRHPWFVWTTASVGALVIICLLGCAISRTRRVNKDKVSPGFEGVASAMDPGSGDATQKGGRRLKGALAKVFSSCWRKRGHTAVPQTDTAQRGKSYASKLRWRRKGSSVANLANAGTGKRGGGRQAAAPSSGAGAAGATPDWIQGIGGAGAGDAGAEPSNAGSNAAGVPDWLAEAAGPAAATAGGGGADANNPGAAYDDSYYHGQGYEGYEDYEGYYEGYDEGYYYQEAGHGTGDGAQGGHGAGAGAGAGTPAATPPPTSAGGAVAGGGGGLSWLTNAASTVNGIDREEEDAP